MESRAICFSRGVPTKPATASAGGSWSGSNNNRKRHKPELSQTQQIAGSLREFYASLKFICRLTLYAFAFIMQYVKIYTDQLVERCYMEYLSVRDTAEKWGISVRRLQVICRQGRIPGAFLVGNSWAIPADAVKPKDKRIKSGKYVKEASLQ